MRVFIKILSGFVLLGCVYTASAATETTPYGKVTGIESRSWGLHVQVDFQVGQALGCAVNPGAMYMLDLSEAKVSKDGGNYEFIQSAVLAAFIAQSDISFHLYECNPSNRPYIGHIRLKN
ncbi:hypothetical protein [Agaribacterium haliotis]|uniref:hypothetical protein n=1 Tax=Agaribacterium haliotis TaxID=2013869 RepID=UPI000BB584B2|nr:hypothetical protein [Agaribacterium haliotis]